MNQNDLSYSDLIQYALVLFLLVAPFVMVWKKNNYGAALLAVMALSALALFRDKSLATALLIFLVITPSIAVWKKNNQGAMVLAAAAVAALLMTRLPDVSTFELFGLKAKLERQASENQATLDQLRKTAAAAAEASLTQLGMSGDIFHMLSTDDKFNMRNNIVSSLKNIGLPEQEILNVQDGWIRTNCARLLGEIVALAKEKKPELNIDEEFKKLPNDKMMFLPSPKTVTDWIETKNLKDEKMSELLKEYNQVWQTGSINNPNLIPPNRNMFIPNNDDIGK